MKKAKEWLKSGKSIKKIKSLTGKLSKKQIRIIAIVLVVLIVAGCFLIAGLGGKDSDTNGPVVASASIGSVEQVIEGSGTISALSQYEITSLKKGEVIADYFEEGDMVEKDDVLYLMDDTDGYDAIDNAKTSLNRANRTYNNAIEDRNNLYVTSKSNGVITEMYVNEGDNVGSNTKICDIIDNTKMILEIQFLSDYASSMVPGVSSAEVTLTKDGTVLYGTVTRVSTGSLTNSVGASVTNVEIKVDNPGAIKEGDYATAVVSGLACSSEGTLRYNSKTSIFSQVSGKVEALMAMKGDNITNGQTIAILSNDDVNDISESAENYQDAQKKYNDAVEGLEDYVVKAPITGTIIQKNIKAGENLETGNANTVMAIIADLSSLVFEMSVDELDISKLNEGMSVEVTADAIEGVTFGATVTNISIVGTSNNGVTSYPVKITIDQKQDQKGMAYENYDKLIPGMNVSASVVIERVDNVIVVPVSAVRRGNIVIINEDSPSEGIDPTKTVEIPSSFAPQRADSSAQRPDESIDSASGKAFDMGADSSGKRQSGFVEPPARENSENTTNTKNTSAKTQSDDATKARLESMMESLDIPDGYKAVFVETGLSDEAFIEIKAGLTEGDKVLLPDSTAASANPWASMGGGMMGGGMMGGGMPPSGGTRNFGGGR